ncbi:hypothetical protein N7530_004347 [Penicillium desertorum]|uniref:Uncharacterized protein n=1 Tax=Penicillium desertorum TaxID=1303715 RepID=A0A9X0BQF5_9EURO|nr:hypothetical protein N7530_004347 [Penicillium desertorum]
MAQHLESQQGSLHILSGFDDTRQQLIAQIVQHDPFLLEQILKSYLSISLSAASGNISNIWSTE